jgi:Skp family chaperone for outer membrane proteins
VILNKTVRVLAVSGIAFAAISTLTLVLGSQQPACAAPAPTGAAALFGSVDIQKVIAGYSKKAELDANLQTTAQQYDDAFQTEQKANMLSSEDQKKLSGLLLEANAPDADKKSAQALEDKSTKDAQALTALQQQHDLSDADKAQLSSLTAEQTSGQQALQDIADFYKTELDKKNGELSAQIAGIIRAAVADVAQQKGLAVVFDSQVAIYSANDVTQAVITKLNSK